MKTTDLLEVLREQKNNLNQFHEVVLMKQRALVMNDIKGIEGAIVREEKIILEVDKTEKTRIEVISLLKDKLNLDYESLRITDFIQQASRFLERKLKDEFKKELDAIEELIIAIQEVNQQNQFLIANARQFIRKIVEAVAKVGKQSLLDRKI
jgi:flagellar biosynthesis/type III secretory pathway chaperone